MAGYEVDPASIESIIDELRTATEGMQYDLDSLKRALRVLLTQWTGEAADAFHVAATDWFSSIGDVCTLLKEITSMLIVVLDRYEETESTVIEACG